MAQSATETINEVDFCAKMASAANAIFATRGALSPFAEARVEGVGSSSGKNKRKDLRFYGPNGQILLTGEVKLPGLGNPNAFDSKVVKDAADKAEDANAKYFFTWDVNTFVLWDRALWEKPLLERRVNVWQLRLNLSSAREVARKENLDFIEKKFLPDLVFDLSDIVSGRRRDWTLAPDEIFLRAMETNLDWPVSLLRNHLQTEAESKSAFDKKLQEWMTSQDRTFARNQPDEWRNAVDNAAQTLAYIWTNRFIFYKALRSRFPELPRLELGPNIKTQDQALRRLNELFRQAADRSGDYESLLFPDAKDWANNLVFAPEYAIDAWRGFLKSIEAVDFRNVPADVVGLIFQKLISPEERHRFGQHFTGPDAVDLINAFCIRKADAAVLDPACGSGSFLVRAYYRKHAMSAKRSHLSMLGELFGCDIALYPAHLATLNLAAREINDEANYPRIDRRDFFHYAPGEPFCYIPEHATHKKIPIELPALDAVVGNPPYVRQEKATKEQKAHMGLLMEEAFKGTKLSGRADLHCYFWPHAARFLKEGAYFGFLTSSQWLDVDYGFALQRWMLRHFKIVAVMESSTERWFPDARVKTCITILQRCADEDERRKNPVRFVRFERPLVDLIRVPATGGVGAEAEEGEQRRQKAVDQLRDTIESIKKDLHNDDWRILVKRQGDLWDDGVVAGTVLKPQAQEVVDDEEVEEDTDAEIVMPVDPGDYVAGKWGRYLRAPDLYFEVMRRFKDRFVPLGGIVDIRRGITSGCDAFFMPKDISEKALADYPSDDDFRSACGGALRKEVLSGKLRIIEDGAGTKHPIEPEFIRPEVHSLMNVDRPVIRAKGLKRVVLMVGGSLSAIKGTWAHRYVKYGEQATYASTKSKAEPVPKRPSCAGRERWYDLTALVKPGFAFWPKSQQYRHIIPANPEQIIANCNLYDIAARELSQQEVNVLTAIMNGTLTALFKTFYGRFAGTEGNLKTEVVDVNLIEVADPRNASKAVATRLNAALKSLAARQVGGMVESVLMDCHSYPLALKLAATSKHYAEELQMKDRRELDDAVFELLGVSDAKERKELLNRLYYETAEHFRAIRVTEIQKMEDRKKGGKSKFTVKDHAVDAWNSLDLTDLTPLSEWLAVEVGGDAAEKVIPSERPVQLASDSLSENETIYFGKRRQQYLTCDSRAEAELIFRVAELGVTGPVRVPTGDDALAALLEKLNARHEHAAKRLRELALGRSGDSDTQVQVFDVLERWFVLGKS